MPDYCLTVVSTWCQFLCYVLQISCPILPWCLSRLPDCCYYCCLIWCKIFLPVPMPDCCLHMIFLLSYFLKHTTQVFGCPICMMCSVVSTFLWNCRFPLSGKLPLLHNKWKLMSCSIACVFPFVTIILCQFLSFVNINLYNILYFFIFSKNMLCSH